MEPAGFPGTRANAAPRNSADIREQSKPRVAHRVEIIAIRRYAHLTMWPSTWFSPDTTTAKEKDKGRGILHRNSKYRSVVD